MLGLIILGIILLILLIVIVSNVKVVPQAHAYVIERLGTYHVTWSTGLHVKIPFIDKISKKVSLKEQVIDFPPQPVITRDNVTMQIDTVVYFEITDPKLYTYGVERPLSAIENLTATTLRNIIGDLELDNTLTSRDTINGKIRVILDEATDAWGIKVIRVELKNILPPREIQDAMEKQMKAERERRARILDAEGEKRSQILYEGMKDIPHVEMLPPEGAFYAWVKFELGLDSQQLCDMLLEKAKIAGVPGIAYGEEEKMCVRFSYAASEESLRQMLVNLKQLMEQM